MFRRSPTYRVLFTVCIFGAIGCSAFGQSGAPADVGSPAGKRVKYGLIVDNTGSMRMQLENVIELVKGIVEENQAGDEAFLVRFVTSDKVVLLQELTSAKEPINEAAGEMYIEGGQTAILDAIKFSANYLDENTKEGTPTAKVLLLISDGDDRESTAKIEQVVAQMKKSNIRLFAVGIADTIVEVKTLEKLTKGTGGKTFLPKGSAARGAAAKAVAAAMRGN